MNHEAMLKPALIGGVLVGVLSAVPVLNAVNCFCCAWVIGGGIFASYLYVRESPLVVTLGRGVGLGLLTGAIGAVVDTVFSIPLYLAMRGAGGFAEQFREILDQVPNLPPETRDALLSIFSESGSTVLLVMSKFLELVIFGFAGMLGGAIGVAIFEKRRPGDGMTTPSPMQPPPSDLPPPPPPPIDES